MGEFFDVVSDIFVERAAVGKDKDNINHLFIGAGFVETVQPISQPTDRQRFAAAGRVLNQKFATDFAGLCKMGFHLLRNISHQAALMVTGHNGECRAFFLVVRRVLVRNVDQEESQAFQQIFF